MALNDLKEIKYHRCQSLVSTIQIEMNGIECKIFYMYYTHKNNKLLLIIIIK